MSPDSASCSTRVAQSVEGVKKVVNNLNTQEPAAG